MKLQIKTLSPVHIGNGEKYNGLSYIQDRRQRPIKLYYLEFDALQKTLTPQQLQSFADWIETERFPSLYKFLRNAINDRNNSFTNSLISKSIYKIDLLYHEDPQQRKFLGDIDAFIKQNNKIYIPGTEIKGAIRTAIAYHLLNIGSGYDWLKDELLKFQNKFEECFSILASSGKRGNQFLILNELRSIQEREFVELFGHRCIETHRRIRSGNDPKIKVNSIKKVLVERVGKIEKALQNRLFSANGKDDAKYDVLKLLHISDTELKNPSECLFVSNLEVRGINRGFPLFQELCKNRQTFTCQDFKLDNNKAILHRLGFNDEQKWIISDIKNLFRCCYEFSSRLLQEEIAYFEKINHSKIVEKLKHIQKQNSHDSPAIRIGKNEGYLSLTVGLSVKEKDKALYDNVLCHATKNTSYKGNFPKTRRIVNLENGDVDTCGWVKLQMIA